MGARSEMLQIQNVSKQFGSKILFEDAQGHISHRSRVALIGPNGAGKSTLIKMVMDLESPDEGKISKVSHLAIGYLPQEVPKMSGRTVLEETLRLDGRREDVLKAKNELETLFSESTPQASDPLLLERYGRVLEELENLDEYRLESRAKAILGGMGFLEKDFHRPLTEFSGGWLMRVALSRILMLDPDLLLLDEPTNHLDLESLLWLEEFLRKSRGALLVISHDTAFLNRIVNEVFEIDQKRLWKYSGNIDAYVVQKEERLKVLRAEYAGQQAKIAEVEAFVAKFGAKASKARQAQSRLKQIEKMDLIELPAERSTVAFRFPPVPHCGKDIVAVREASLKFPEKNLFHNLNWLIRKGTRTAIVGVNGAGKTSLLKLLAQQILPTGGEVRLGSDVKVGYYSQMQAETLNMENTVIQELESVAPDWPVAQVRAVAGAFLFSGEAVHKKCKVLSGGEKARVALAKLLLSPSNFLILDEPTNHLDVESRDMLLSALMDYSGTLCLVSHDREFVAPLVDRLLEIEPNPQGSEVIHSTQTYEEYLERKIREAKSALSSEYSPSKESKIEATSASSKKASNNQIRSWQREKEKIESTIELLERQKGEILAEMSEPQSYGDQNQVKNLIERQQDIEKKLESSYLRWEELSLLLEKSV